MKGIASDIPAMRDLLLRNCSPDDAPQLAWRMVCGERVHRQTNYLGFTNGRLTIATVDQSWRLQLQKLAPEYLVSLNQISPVPIKYLEFVASA